MAALGVLLWTGIVGSSWHFLSMVGSGGTVVSGLGLMSISVDKFDADLLGQSELDLLAGGGSQLSLAFGDGFGRVFDFGDSDAFLLAKISTAHTGKGDGFVNAGLDGLGVGDLDGNIDGGDNRHIVGSFLSDLLAVVVSVRSVAISMSGLADGDHLDIGFLFEGDFNGFASGVFVLLLVGVRADLLGDLLNGLGTNSTGDGVAEFLVDNDLDGQLNILADSFESGGADFGDFSHILNSAVVFGFLVAITTIVGGGVTVGRGVMGRSVSGGSMVGSLRMVGTIAGGGVVGHGSHEGEESQNSECLNVMQNVEIFSSCAITFLNLPTFMMFCLSYEPIKCDALPPFPQIFI